jgi:phage tail tape-measure protein
MAISTLEKLQQKLPGAIQKGAAQQESARMGALQSAVAGAPSDVNISKTASTIGQSLASQAGKDQLARVNQAVNEQQAESQVAISQRSRELEARIDRKKKAINRLGEKNAERLYQTNKEVANELIDNRNQFVVDQAGRRYLNEHQLMDFKRLTAQNDQELKDYAQRMQIQTDRKLQVMETVYKKLDQLTRQEYDKDKQQLDQASKEKLVQIKQAYQQKLEDERKKAAKRSGMAAVMGQVGGAAGSVLGSYFGPVGTVVGSAVGTAAGSAIGGAMADQGIG